MKKQTFTLAEIAPLVDAKIHGDNACVITGVASLETAKAGEASFFDNSRYRKYLVSTDASVVILAEKNLPDCNSHALVTPNPELVFAKLAALFQKLPIKKPGTHPTAVIGNNCTIAPSASIGPRCIIENNTIIGENTIVHPGCVIGEHCIIGSNCKLWPNITIYHGVAIGDNAIIHSGVVIGADGFGITMKNDHSWHKIPQLGAVKIGNHVEIGANTTIDRGALGDTVIEDGVKLDNQIQIAHNVHIGAHTAIAGCVGIAGSAKIGRHCMIGGAACIIGHITIADNVIITGMTGISKSIKEPGVYSAIIPGERREIWKKNATQFRHLNEIATRLKKLEKTVASIGFEP